MVPNPCVTWSRQITRSLKYNHLSSIMISSYKAHPKMFNVGQVGFPVAQMVKNLPATQEIWVWSPGQEDPLEKGMATHSSILAWRIPWAEEPGGLQSMGWQRVRHNWVTNAHTKCQVRVKGGKISLCWLCNAMHLDCAGWCTFLITPQTKNMGGKIHFVGRVNINHFTEVMLRTALIFWRYMHSHWWIKCHDVGICCRISWGWAGLSL